MMNPVTESSTTQVLSAAEIDVLRAMGDGHNDKVYILMKNNTLVGLKRLQYRGIVLSWEESLVVRGVTFLIECELSPVGQALHKLLA